MPRWELESLTNLKGLTYNQINLLNCFYSQFDNRSAANRRIINVEPLYYAGVIAGTEFLTYAATKLYIGLEVKCSDEDVLAVNIYFTSFYNAANAVEFCLMCQDWELLRVAGDGFIPETAYIENIIFSKIVTTYPYILFNGFRITLI